jgi:hypothetical protein
VKIPRIKAYQVAIGLMFAAGAYFALLSEQLKSETANIDHRLAQCIGQVDDDVTLRVTLETIENVCIAQHDYVSRYDNCIDGRYDPPTERDVP